MVTFTYTSKTNEERQANTRRIYQELLNNKLEQIGADYRVSYDISPIKKKQKSYEYER